MNKKGKIIKKNISNLITLFFVAIISIPVAFFSIALDPQLQTISARFAASFLSNEFQAKVSIERLSISPFLDVILKEVYVEDKQNDTLIYANDLKVNIANPLRKRDKIQIVGVSAKNAVIKLHKYKGDTSFNINMISDFFKSDKQAEINDTIQSPGVSLLVKNAELENVSFSLINETRPRKDKGMDYHNLGVKVKYCQVKNIRIINDSIFSTVRELACKENSGLIVESMSGEFVVSPQCLIAENLLLKTAYSDIDLDFSFTYDNWNAYLDFVNDVKITSEIRKSTLNLKDIGYFANALSTMNNPIRIGGNVKGRVSNLRAKGFRFSYGKDTRFYGDISMNGLPNIENTYTHLNIHNFEASQNDIKSFSLPIESKYIAIPESLSELGNVNIKGSFTGFFNDFVSYGSFSTSLGEFSTDLIVKQHPKASVSYDGKITAEKFNIGKLLNLGDYLGTFSITALIDGKGLNEDNVVINMNAIVDSLEFMGNSFNKIEIKGEVSENQFNGNANIEDELGQLLFDGNVDFKTDIPVFDFTADIKNAKLYELNLGNRYEDMELSSKLRCNFVGYKLDDLEGRINIDSTRYYENHKSYSLDKFALITLKDTGTHKSIMISSDIFDATIKGSFLFNELKPAISNTIDQYLTSEYIGLDKNDININTQLIDYKIQLKDTDGLTDLFIPDLLISPETYISGSYKSNTNNFILGLKSPRIKYQGLKLNSIDFTSNTSPNNFSFDLLTDNLRLKESSETDSLNLGLDSLKITSLLRNDSVLFTINWNDKTLDDKNIGDIEGYIAFIDTNKVYSMLTKAEVVINDSSWTVSKDNHILFEDDLIDFNDFKFIGQNQELGINGLISDNNNDTLDIIFKKWHISNFDFIFNKEGFDLDGIIDGRIMLSGIKGIPNFNSDIVIDRLHFNDVLLGNANILGSWDNDEKCVDMDVEVRYIGNIGTSKTLDLNGKYYPYDTIKNFDIDLSIENFKLKALRPFTDELFEKLDGIASGNVTIKGSINDPLLNGSVKFMRTSLVVNYLNTKYEFADDIKIENTGFSFKDLTVYDTLGNTAICNGKISHNKFKDFRIDVDIDPKDFICLNTNRYQNETFYGSAIATGKVNITGPFDNLKMDIDATTNNGTDLFVPINSTTTLSQNNYIIFINSQDDTISNKKIDRKLDVKGLTLDLNINVTNEAEIQIFLPDQMGNITSRGTGNLEFGISPSGEFRMRGDYIIDRGSFLFKIQNLLRKKFELLSGGKISFTGNPLDATINARALYKVKTSLTGISTALDELYGGERVNVDCILHLKERLMNPEIKFTLRFPKLDTDIQQYVFAVIDTNNQAMMNQQMISLLVLNSFSYTSSGNIGASSFNIISNQLSNWLSQISRDFDVGINYRPGDEITEDEIQVALSTQLFDNRLIIDGNLGVSSERNSQDNASNIVGDVDIEYKLRPDGRVRLRAFNRSNNMNTFDDIAPYTQGVGIFYRKEFNKFSDIFKKRKKITQANLSQ